MNPHDTLRYHVSGAIERGEAEPIEEAITMEPYEKLWDDDEPVCDRIDVPRWIEQDITGSQIAAICQGGCASGAYMPAVTYATALETMTEHGDAIFDFIENAYGRLPTPDPVESWAGLAVHYVSTAVDLWALGFAQFELERIHEEEEREEQE